MPLTFSKNSVAFEGLCPVDDALPLLEFLQAHPTARITLAGCTHMHTALLQVLLACQPRLVNLPADPFLDSWLRPILTQFLVKGRA